MLLYIKMYYKFLFCLVFLFSFLVILFCFLFSFFSLYLFFFYEKVRNKSLVLNVPPFNIVIRSNCSRDDSWSCLRHELVCDGGAKAFPFLDNLGHP